MPKKLLTVDIQGQDGVSVRMIPRVLTFVVKDGEMDMLRYDPFAHGDIQIVADRITIASGQRVVLFVET